MPSTDSNPPPRSLLPSPAAYAEEFRLTLDPPCTVDFDRFLVQLGLPTPHSLTLWYALPANSASGARGWRPDEQPRVQLVEVMYEGKWVEAECHDPAILQTPGGKGRIDIGGLEASDRYRVKVRWRDEVLDVEASTAPAPDAAPSFRFLAWSCLQPYGYHHKDDQPFIPLRTANSLRLLERRAAAVRDRPDFALALGDQVYVDENARRRGKRALLVGKESDQRRYQGDARPYLDVAYRRTFAIPPVDEAFKNLPHVMMWDDHEIRDGWGSRGDEYPDAGVAGGGAPSPWQDHLLAAREQFRDFQALRNPLPIQLKKRAARAGVGGGWSHGRLDDFMKPEPGPEAQPEPRRHEAPQPYETHFQFRWGKAATFFVMDLRSRRNVKAADGPRVISEAQIEDLAEWLASVDAETPMLFVLGSPLPLFHDRTWTTSVEERLFRRVRADDVRDNWWSESNSKQRDRLIAMLADHFDKAPRHRLLVVSGDCHFSEVLELRSHSDAASEPGPVFGHEVVTSGLALASFYRIQGPWSNAPTTFAKRVRARGFGRFRGPCFAELVVTPGADNAPPEVAVTFTPATTVLGRTLANTTEITQFKLHLPVGPRTAPGQRCKCQETPAPPEGAAALDSDEHDADEEQRSERARREMSGCLSRIDTRTGWFFFRRFVEPDFRNEKSRWAAPGWRGEITYREVIEAEREQIASRRQVLGRQAPRSDDPDLFGVALSGGGVRSAAISFGFLRELDRTKFLVHADYMSTVSGGGYAGGHLQTAMVRKARERSADSGKPLAERPLLDGPTLRQLSRQGHYLAPGKGLRAALEMATLVSSYLMSLPVTFIPLLAIAIAFGMLMTAATTVWAPARLAANVALDCAALLALAAIAFRLLVVPFWRPSRDWRRRISCVEAATLSLLVLCGLGSASRWLAGVPTQFTIWVNGVMGQLAQALRPEVASAAVVVSEAREHAGLIGPLAALLTAVVIGYLANANSLSMHGVFSDRILKAFLAPITRDNESLRLAELAASERLPVAGPYPLINGCLNLLGERDPAFAGARASDYFLFSPLYCGAKLTGYASTRWRRYSDFSLAKAVAVSAASVAPGMGNASSAMFSVVASIFNWRLGIWMSNPRRPAHWMPYFWPWYGLLELTNHTSSKRRLLNVTDGGFIDNLGVFELLRRRCKVILAIDNTHDPVYDFHYLQNLVIRARQELGVHIALPDDAEATMRPAVIRGMSNKQFVLAPITRAASRPGPEYQGLLIYAKATLSEEKDAIEGQKVRTKARAYKKFHPSFPQESTFDQFFDDAQWEAYYELGQEIAEAVVRDDGVLKALEELSTKGTPVTRLIQLVRACAQKAPVKASNGNPPRKVKKTPTPPGTPMPPATPPAAPIGNDDPTSPGFS